MNDKSDSYGVDAIMKCHGGNGCGSVGRAVASDIGSNPVIGKIHIERIEKTKIKKTEAMNGP